MDENITKNDLTSLAKSIRGLGYTPTNWALIDDHEGRSGRWQVCLDNGIIAEVYEVKADAAIIAAAPELLEIILRLTDDSWFLGDQMRSEMNNLLKKIIINS